MPYTKKINRFRFEDAVKQIIKNMTPQTCAGDLNFIISSLMNGYVRSKGQSYQVYNDLLGVLEGAKLELYRRHIGPYEQDKIKENGDLE